jgi:hypothetical protein
MCSTRVATVRRAKIGPSFFKVVFPARLDMFGEPQVPEERVTHCARMPSNSTQEVSAHDVGFEKGDREFDEQTPDGAYDMPALHVFDQCVGVVVELRYLRADGHRRMMVDFSLQPLDLECPVYLHDVMDR